MSGGSVEAKSVARPLDRARFPHEWEVIALLQHIEDRTKQPRRSPDKLRSRTLSCCAGLSLPGPASSPAPASAMRKERDVTLAGLARESHAPPSRAEIGLTFLAFPLWCHRAYRLEAGRDSYGDVNLARVHRLLFSSDPHTGQERHRRLSHSFRALDRRKQPMILPLSNELKRIALRLFRER